jgi:hypothetical protein
MHKNTVHVLAEKENSEGVLKTSLNSMFYYKIQKLTNMVLLTEAQLFARKTRF